MSVISKYLIELLHGYLFIITKSSDGPTCNEVITNVFIYLFLKRISMVVTCPDLPNSCDGLSACCDRNYGNWLIGSKCGSRSFCGSEKILSRCDCVRDFGRNPGALAAIIIASVILLLICCCWCRSKKKEPMVQGNHVNNVQPMVQGNHVNNVRV